ncbi:MAG: condensation domain-containing protein [Peptostreptococcaceae bacterium]|jgi:yersiniabactin nonribosomal peptide synthetase|nr:condensation domain-containing protein [Peptostreptococcaceae bacterium]
MYISNTEYDEAFKIIELLNDEGISISKEDGKLKYKAKDKSSIKKMFGLLKDNKELLIKYLDYKKFDENSFPLTSIQSAYVLGRKKEYQLGGVSTNYYFELKFKSLDIKKIEDAINTIIKNNQALRTVVFKDLFQKVFYDVPRFKIQKLDIKKEDIDEYRPNLISKMHELEKWPMFSVKHTDYGNEDILHFTFDCMVLDALSINLFLKNLFKLYQDKDIIWPKYTFKEYVNTHMSKIEKQDDEKAKEYWCNRLKNMNSYPKLVDEERINNIKKPRFKRINHLFSKEDTEVFYKKCIKNRVTPASVIATIYMKAISKHTSDNIAINSTTFNRNMVNEDMFDIMGDFTNIFLIHHDFKDKNILTSFKDIQKQFMQIVRFKDYDGTKIIKSLTKDPKKLVMPVVFTCVLNGLKKPKDEYLMDGVKLGYSVSQTPQVFLDYQVTDFTKELSLSWDYVDQAFDKEFLELLFSQNINMVKSLINSDDWNLDW